jgi:hypothetical protein
MDSDAKPRIELRKDAATWGRPTLVHVVALAALVTALIWWYRAAARQAFVRTPVSVQTACAEAHWNPEADVRGHAHASTGIDLCDLPGSSFHHRRHLAAFALTSGTSLEGAREVVVATADLGPCRRPARASSKTGGARSESAPARTSTSVASPIPRPSCPHWPRAGTSLPGRASPCSACRK